MLTAKNRNDDIEKEKRGKGWVSIIKYISFLGLI